MELRRHLRIYIQYFVQFWKTRLVYKTDFLLNGTTQMINLATSLAFLTLIFTQVKSLNGWNFNEMLFLAGFGGLAMNIHHIFMLNIYHLGDDYVVTGRLDRFLVRPLNVLFQVYADNLRDENLPKLFTNLALIVYASGQLEIRLLTIPNLLYGLPALISAVLAFGSIYLAFASLSFWTGRSKPIIWIIFRVSDFRRYPYSIYAAPIKALLVTLIPLAFASFFPSTFFLNKPGWEEWQFVSIVAGPALFYLSYRFFRFGLDNYSSTGS